MEEAGIEVCLYIIKHWIKTTEYVNVLVSFDMVLSVYPDKTWETLVNLATKISTITATSIVTYAVGRLKSMAEGQMEDGVAREDATSDSFALQHGGFSGQDLGGSRTDVLHYTAA